MSSKTPIFSYHPREYNQHQKQDDSNGSSYKFYENALNYQKEEKTKSKRSTDAEIEIINHEPTDYSVTNTNTAKDATSKDAGVQYQKSHKDYCMYDNVKRKVDDCFAATAIKEGEVKNNSCIRVLQCISSLNLVEVCHHYDMNTPAIWLIQVFEILQHNAFCQIVPATCVSTGIDYLTDLNQIITSFSYRSSSSQSSISENRKNIFFLDQPKSNTKIYCSKAGNLVSDVQQALMSIDECVDELESAEHIFNQVDESARAILDLSNCLHCVDSESIFKYCIMDNYENEFNCSSSMQCMQRNMATHQCDENLEQQEQTPLNLIASFLKNVSTLCEPPARSAQDNDEEKYLWEHQQAIESNAAVDWFAEVQLCLTDVEAARGPRRWFMGLTLSELEFESDSDEEDGNGDGVCEQMDQVLHCIQRSVHSDRLVLARLQPQFNAFAQRFKRLQRQCAVQATIVQHKKKEKKNQQIKSPHHTFKNNSEQTVLESDINYYHQTVVRAEHGQSINWIDIDQPRFKEHNVKQDADLSKNYLKATIVKLKFKFSYYGHSLNEVVVATGGFLYVGSLMNPLITKAQYIAPLMANFDPTLNLDRTNIKYVDNSTHFIVTWERLVLQDQPDNGEYTFQVVLNKDGDITFNYLKIPSVNISTVNHTVKVGLSDAYVFYKILSTSKIEYTIVQYHMAIVSMDHIRTGNSVMFFMLKNCLQMKTCDKCVSGVGDFKCIWCPILQRCSDTMDRYRQEWIESSCPIEYKANTSIATCQLPENINYAEANMATDVKTDKNNNNNIHNRFEHGTQIEGVTSAIDGGMASLANHHHQDANAFRSAFLGVFITICTSMAITTIGWGIYAYRNPTTTSGIWLIEHRPSRLIEMVTTRLDKRRPASSRFENPDS